MRPDGIYVVGVGAQTPVGRSVGSAAAAVKCGISAYAEHGSVTDKHGEPVVVAQADWLQEMCPLAERILTFAVDAAREALTPLTSNSHSLRDVTMYLVLSADNLPEPARREEVLRSLQERLGFAPGDQAALVAEGPTGGFVALENACRALRTGEATHCLVGGADSWLDANQLRALDRSGRLHSTRNSWGFTPGEGAGFLLLTTGTGALRLGLPGLAEIVAVANAQESKLLGTQTVCIGEGLTAAFRGVLSPALPVTHCYCDFNGETYRAEEYGFSVCRTGECFQDAGRFTAGAECWGDVGSASAPLGMVLATASFKNLSRGPVALVWGSGASHPGRGAALLRALRLEEGRN
jgi:3-oxoacyl-[acyl-carrier-protein] synthase-1